MTTERNATTDEAVRYGELLEALKVQKRTGWVRMNVQGAESIADHMYRMGVMALVAGEASGLDPFRCMRVAITHDLAEAIVGDITPHCGVDKPEKQRRERAAIQQIQQLLGGTTPAALEVRELWEEYEANSSPVALLVKDLDKLEMILQAYEYERAQGRQDLQEFFDSTRDKFKTDIGKQWAAEVVEARTTLPTAAHGEPQWSSVLQLFSLISNLKKTKRKGWVIKKIPDAESIADHMHRMAMLAMVSAYSSGVDPSRAVAMALVHDLAEAVVGDITPHCGVSAEDKYAREQQALRSLVALLEPYPATAKLVEGLWEEFEAGTSDVALLVTDLDKLEMILQAHQYEQRHGIRLQEFFDSTANYFKTPTVKQWAEEVRRLRQAKRPA